NPWAKRDEWRKHPTFSQRAMFSRMFPGFGVAVVALQPTWSPRPTSSPQLRTSIINPWVSHVFTALFMLMADRSSSKQE
ncbi:hypothetical protein BC629DRAFT_1285650, partial [Irpex lacteus]